MLNVRDLVVEIGGKTIVDGVTFQVRAGDKVGLVGRNGAGKTTLFKVLGGAVPPKAGTARREGATGYLSQDPRQEPVPDDTNCLAHVLSGRGLDAAAERLEKLRIAMEEDASERNIIRFTDAQERFENDGGYSAEAEARRFVDGLGLAADRLELTLGALSGGERRRLELARILFAGSDLLLLDEPTNHLDADARDWLLRFLRGYRGGLLVISHDLDLLDEAITRVVHLDREEEEAVGEIVEYKGTYSQYLKSRAADEERLAKVAEQQQSEIRRLSAQADKMRGQTAKRARVAKNLDRRVARIEEHRVDGPSARRSLDLRFPEPPSCGRTVITAREVWKSFGALDVFSDVSFDVGRGERLLIMGLNGAGKTTLLKVLAGQLEPDLGDVELGLRVEPGYYAQEHEGITGGRSLLDHMRDQAGLGDEMLRALIGMFGLSGDKAFQDAATLSGGEKTKLALAQLVAGRHNLLLLDEPTNNLDPMSRAAIGQALASWPGTMIVVSHDAEFVRHLAPDRCLMMPEGQLDYFSAEMLDLVEIA
ncbi:ABC-F family ATP-binding cassette domain-containing protein [Rhabdothermincola salaria]|uniref:ABC-F family ATP-binding cassette domain-containing protein n=1 Tax=Rhabdothermincola salaria TaxID=2903142 RepID=UPI001E4B3C0E|nr:ATP-binding cassette domain-containing protein [Rhabdothermincola salaria]